MVRAANRQKVTLATVGITEGIRGPSVAGQGLTDSIGHLLLFFKCCQSCLVFGEELWNPSYRTIRKAPQHLWQQIKSDSVEMGSTFRSWVNKQEATRSMCGLESKSPGISVWTWAILQNPQATFFFELAQRAACAPDRMLALGAGFEIKGLIPKTSGTFSNPPL